MLDSTLIQMLSQPKTFMIVQCVCVENNLQIPSNLAMHNLCIIYASTFSFTIHVHYLRYLLKISQLRKAYMNLSIRTPSSHSRVVYKDLTRETTKGCSLTSLLSKFRNIDGVALKKIDQICSCSQRGMVASFVQ